MASKKSNGAKVTAARAIEKERRLCPVKLSAAERATRGDEMAECEMTIEKIRSERSELSRQVKTHEKRRNELGHVIDTGTEQRELLCSWEPDYAHSVFRLKRPDTDEQIDQRPMSAQDLTIDLFPPSNGAAAADAAPPPAPPPRSPKPKRSSSRASTDRPAA